MDIVGRTAAATVIMAIYRRYHERQLGLLTKLGDDCCAICLEGPSRGDSMGSLVEGRCEHIFHRACLETSLETRDACPLCRKVSPLGEGFGARVRFLERGGRAILAAGLVVGVAVVARGVWATVGAAGVAVVGAGVVAGAAAGVAVRVEVGRAVLAARLGEVAARAVRLEGRVAAIATGVAAVVGGLGATGVAGIATGAAAVVVASTAVVVAAGIIGAAVGVIAARVLL